MRSGALQKTIKATKSAGGAKVNAGTPGLLSKVPYAGSVHYGWEARGIEAQPFLSDALDDVGDEVLDAYGKLIEDLLKKAGLK